jgi:hypothetical protein
MTKIKELTVTNIRKFFRRICVEFAALIPIIALVFFLLNASLSKDSFTLTKEKILLNEKDFISQKFLMFIAVWSMILTSGLGVVGAFVGIAVPFIIFIVIHMMLGSTFWKHRRDMAAFKRGTDDLNQGVEGIKSFGRAVRGESDGTIPHR